MKVADLADVADVALDTCVPKGPGEDCRAFSFLSMGVGPRKEWERIHVALCQVGRLCDAPF